MIDNNLKMYNVTVFYNFSPSYSCPSLDPSTISSKFGVTERLGIAKLGLFEVDDIPDRGEILHMSTDYVSFHGGMNETN